MVEPSVSDVEMWLEWQAKQLGTPAWWSELKAILGVKDPQKLSCKIRASFYIPKVGMRASPNQQYTAPPAPKCHNRIAFILDELSYQDICQQPTLLTVAYARDLQYWVEKLNHQEVQTFAPLGGECSRTEGGHTRTCHLQPLGCCPGLESSPSGVHEPVASDHFI